jgi:hypothetical protein
MRNIFHLLLNIRWDSNDFQHDWLFVTIERSDIIPNETFDLFHSPLLHKLLRMYFSSVAGSVLVLVFNSLSVARSNNCQLSCHSQHGRPQDHTCCTTLPVVLSWDLFLWHWGLSNATPSLMIESPLAPIAHKWRICLLLDKTCCLTMTTTTRLLIR